MLDCKELSCLLPGQYFIGVSLSNMNISSNIVHAESQVFSDVELNGPDLTRDETTDQGEDHVTEITSHLESMQMTMVNTTNSLEKNSSDHVEEMFGDFSQHNGQGEKDTAAMMTEDDFGDFECISNSNNPSSPSYEEIHVDAVYSDDPFVQKFAIVTKKIFAHFLPTNIDSYRHEDQGENEIPRSIIEEYLVRVISNCFLDIMFVFIFRHTYS